MKKLDGKTIKKIMYSQKLNEREEVSEDTKLTVSKDFVLIESKGQKQTVPSMTAFTKLLNEHDNLRGNHNKAVKEINVLRESIKILIRTINEMDEEIKNKIDKIDHND